MWIFSLSTKTSYINNHININYNSSNRDYANWRATSKHSFFMALAIYIGVT